MYNKTDLTPKAQEKRGAGTRESPRGGTLRNTRALRSVQADYAKPDGVARLRLHAVEIAPVNVGQFFDRLATPVPVEPPANNLSARDPENIDTAITDLAIAGRGRGWPVQCVK